MSSYLGDNELIFFGSDGTQVDFKMEVVNNIVQYSSDFGKMNMIGLGSIETDNGLNLKSLSGSKICLTAPINLTSDHTLIFPEDTGVTGSVLTTDGNGLLSWTQGGGQSTPGGLNTQLQYNNGGSFGGLSTLTTDGTNLDLSGGLMNFGSSMTIHPSKITNSQGHLVLEQTSSFSQIQFVLGGDSMIEQFVFKNSSNKPILNMGGDGFVNIHSYLLVGFSDFEFIGGFPRFSLDSSKFTDDSTSANGTQQVWYAASFGKQELAASNINVTTTTASTVYIDGDVTQGQNQTIQNNYSLLVGSGKSLFQGTVETTDLLCSDCEVSNLITSNRYETQGNLFITGNSITSVETLTFGSSSGGSLPITYEGVSNLNTLKLPLLDAAVNTVLYNDGTGQLSWGSPGTMGPGTTTDNAIVRWDGTDGKNLKNSIPQITDTGNITNVGGYFGASMILTGTANAVQHTTTGSVVMNGDDIKGVELLELGTAKTIFISKESDFPNSIGGFHTLVDNTNYIITNQITMVDGIHFGVNTSISGAGLSSSMAFSDTVKAFKSINQHVSISNLKIIGGGNNVDGLCDFQNIDYNGSQPYWGRDKMCEINNVRFVNFYNLGIIDGFKNVCITTCKMTGTITQQNPLNGFKLSNIFDFKFNDNNMSLFNTSTLGYIIKIANNNTYNPLGANIGLDSVIISGNIMNPDSEKICIDIEPLSTTHSGTIIANTFNQYNPSTPIINYTNQSVFDNYNPTEIKNYIVSDNSGVVNAYPDAKVEFNNNTKVINVSQRDIFYDIETFTNNIDNIKLNTKIGVQMTMDNVVPFSVNEIITGVSSGAQARVVDVVSATEYYIVDSTDKFNNDEYLTGSLGGQGSISTFYNTGVKMKIKYLNREPRKLSLIFSCQLAQTSGGGIAWELGFLYNDVIRTCTATVEVIRSSRPSTVSVLCMDNFKYGDTVSWVVRNLDGTQNCLVRRATLICGPS